MNCPVTTHVPQVSLRASVFSVFNGNYICPALFARPEMLSQFWINYTGGVRGSGLAKTGWGVSGHWPEHIYLGPDTCYLSDQTNYVNLCRFLFLILKKWKEGDQGASCLSR